MDSREMHRDEGCWNNNIYYIEGGSQSRRKSLLKGHGVSLFLYHVL